MTAGAGAAVAEPGAACPRCGAGLPPKAKFCPACGGALQGPSCGACGAESGAGDVFCTQCGEGLRGVGRGGRRRGARVRGGVRGRGGVHRGEQAQPGGFLRDGRFGLGGGADGTEDRRRLAGAVGWVAAVSLGLALALVLIVRGGGGDDADAPGPVPPSAAGGAALGPTSAVDLSSMTPREAAIRLFNRVMAAVEGGDRAQADLFLPMAIASYDRIGTLTLDDRFHLSLLHAATGDGAAALAVAEAGLMARPAHLLCLAAAAQAAALLGDSAKTTAHWRAFLDAYDEEIRSGLAEYGPPPDGHAPLLPSLRAQAEAHLAASG